MASPWVFVIDKQLFVYYMGDLESADAGRFAAKIDDNKKEMSYFWDALCDTQCNLRDKEIYYIGTDGYQTVC